MNVRSLQTVPVALMLFGVLTACQQKAPEAAAPAPAAAPATSTPPETAAPTAAPAAEAEAAPTAIPETADAIWQAIDQHSAELKTTIASGTLGEVHHHAFAIRDLVAALPSHSPTLSTEDQVKLEGEVKFVTTLADRLDQTGDANDKVGTQENYDKLVTVLNGITRYK